MDTIYILYEINIDNNILFHREYIKLILLG